MLLYYQLPYYFGQQAIFSLSHAELKFTVFILLHVEGIP
jgi:hypothetical protein